MPEARFAAAQVTGEAEEREVRVRMIARRAHRLEEATEALEQRRRVEDAVLGEATRARGRTPRAACRSCGDSRGRAPC